MFPIKLTPRREAILARTWRILTRLAVLWALAMVVLVFSGLWPLLPAWAVALAVAPGLLGTLVLVVSWCADCTGSSTSREPSTTASARSEVRP